jgi:hypothetical protein
MEEEEIEETMIPRAGVPACGEVTEDRSEFTHATKRMASGRIVKRLRSIGRVYHKNPLSFAISSIPRPLPPKEEGEMPQTHTFLSPELVLSEAEGEEGLGVEEMEVKSTPRCTPSP